MQVSLECNKCYSRDVVVLDFDNMSASLCVCVCVYVCVCVCASASMTLVYFFDLALTICQFFQAVYHCRLFT